MVKLGQKNSYSPRIAVATTIIVIALALQGCSLTKNFSENEYLLKKNRINTITQSKEHSFGVGDLERYYRQKPNKRTFRLVPFHAAAYNFGDRINIPDSTGFSKFRKVGRNTKDGFKRWVMRNGEIPVKLDTIATGRTVSQMESFLFTKGHFSAKVESQTTYKKGKKAIVTYMVYPGSGHSIRYVTDTIATPKIKMIYDLAKSESLIKEGTPYDEKLLQQERDRISRILKDSGFYHFNKAYITYDVDTFIDGDSLDIKFKIPDQSFYLDDAVEVIHTSQHRKSKIRNISINPEYEGVFAEREYKLVPVTAEIDKSGSLGIYRFFTLGDQLYKPAVLVRNIHIQPNRFYSQLDVERTYLSLTDLGNFRNISISFTDVLDSTMQTASDTSVLWIDCNINLTPEMKQAYEIRFDMTNRAGDPGIAANLAYQNRNLFGGAEILGVVIKGALEVQQVLDKSIPVRNIFNNLPFNTVELGAEANLRIPKLLAPVKYKKLSPATKTVTLFSGGVNFQERPDFKRYVTKISTAYEWQYRPNIFMTFSPFEANAVSILPHKSFLDKLHALNDQRLLYSYSNHLVTALTYAVLIDNRSDKSRKKFSFTRFNIESAGFLVNTLKKPLNYKVNEDGIALLFSVPYAQYIRADIDYRNFFRLKQRDHVVATRVYLGLGNPYGNSLALPFEKSFFVGGANGIRAWQMRTLGPGSYYDKNVMTRFDRTGDLCIESSIEYRFPMYGSIHGALFLDAGNVWLKNKNEKFPGGEFQFKNFIGEMGLGTGFGIRIVSFFVIRLDAGIRVHDPSLVPNDRWVIDEFRFKRINWNAGIGYSI